MPPTVYESGIKMIQTSDMRRLTAFIAAIVAFPAFIAFVGGFWIPMLRYVWWTGAAAVAVAHVAWPAWTMDGLLGVMHGKMHLLTTVRDGFSMRDITMEHYNAKIVTCTSEEGTQGRVLEGYANHRYCDGVLSALIASKECFKMPTVATSTDDGELSSPPPTPLPLQSWKHGDIIKVPNPNSYNGFDTHTVNLNPVVFDVSEVRRKLPQHSIFVLAVGMLAMHDMRCMQKAKLRVGLMCSTRESRDDVAYGSKLRIDYVDLSAAQSYPEMCQALTDALESGASAHKELMATPKGRLTAQRDALRSMWSGMFADVVYDSWIQIRMVRAVGDVLLDTMPPWGVRILVPWGRGGGVTLFHQGVLDRDIACDVTDAALRSASADVTESQTPHCEPAA